VTTQAVEPGRILAGRYRVEDLLDEVGGVRSWRAADEVLRRAVFVQTVPAEDERAEAITRAARAAAHVGDTRFLQVLDVDEVDGVAYFVREWLPGQNLASMLAAGPLDPDQAATLGREVAEAIASAHSRNVSHLRLEPSSVIIAPNGSVKIAGLGTEAALRGAEESEPAAADTAGVGRILYAALTGRWPGDGDRGLPEAMRIEGRFASPRQVRPGVPRLLDEVVDRALGNGDRHHATPLVTPGEIAEALSGGAIGSWGNAVLGDSGDNPWPPPALLDQPPTRMTSNRAVPMVPGRDERNSGQRTILRAVGVLVASLFLIGAAFLGWRMLLGAVSPDDQATSADPVPSPTAEESPEPSGEESEDPEEGEEPADGDVSLTLSADSTSVSPGTRINLDGTLEPSVGGVELRVERSVDGGEWASFPDDSSQVTTQTKSDGRFSTWVNTSRQGENQWRLVGTVDGERVESNTVTVTVN
jgi:hypothetical protein